MVLTLYNTLTRKKEIFTPLSEAEVTVYTCGPTVYWFQHIGNFRSYIFADALRRVLLYNGYPVKQIINITDVGHLTSDADTGDDKMEQAAQKEGKTAQEIANYYFTRYHEDRQKLFLKDPEVSPKASEHIQEQIDMIKTLESKGYTYKTDDGIYFDSSKFSDYGNLSNKKIDNQEAGKRIDMGSKKNSSDFALWKFSEESGKRQQEWESPWGLGFPGWHIECSAMSTKYLGSQFDIHTGGEDHMHVHHENEIAQSEAALDVHPWVTYWMHGAFLTIRGDKMGKSKGNIETISELEDRGIPALAYKYFTYTGHYRKPLTWSEESIQSAVKSYTRLKNIVSELLPGGDIDQDYLSRFEERINDDLDMPGALAVLWEFVRDTGVEYKIPTIKKMEEVFALGLFEKEVLDIPKEVIDLAEERTTARLEKNWKRSDELRDELLSKGWRIIDKEHSYLLERHG